MVKKRFGVRIVIGLGIQTLKARMVSGEELWFHLGKQKRSSTYTILSRERCAH